MYRERKREIITNEIREYCFLHFITSNGIFKQIDKNKSLHHFKIYYFL